MEQLRLDPDKCPVFEPTFTAIQCLYFDPADNPKECGYCKRKEYYRCLADVNSIIPLSHSSTQDFLTCRHLYYLKAIRGIQVKNAAQSSALKCGTLWDNVLQKYLGGKDRNGKPIDIPKIIEDYEIENREIAKVKALYRAYKELEIQTDPNPQLQYKIDITIPFDKSWGNDEPVELMVTGFYDRKYTDYFVENKLSGRPDYYLDLWHIQSQVGTYFLADPNLQSCIMEIARIPDLKPLKETKKRANEESDEAYQERCFQDILSRPSHYFIGYNKDTHHYGKKYHRGEFSLDEIKSRYLHILKEIYQARLMDGFYKNDRACAQVLPGIPCDMLPICRYNNWSETIYQIREKQSL